MKQKKPQISQLKKATFPQPPKFSYNKQFGVQARVSAMHSIQRASGRRGN